MSTYTYEVEHIGTPSVVAGMTVNGGTVTAVAFYPVLQAASLADDLADALVDLLTEQNGPPLLQRKGQWDKAMSAAHEALERYEELKK